MTVLGKNAALFSGSVREKPEGSRTISRRRTMAGSGAGTREKRVSWITSCWRMVQI